MITYLKDFVELRTKVASVFPYLFTLSIYLYAFADYDFKLILAVLFFISMLCLDMATTALNHLAGMNEEESKSKYDQKLLADMKRLGITNKFNKVVFNVLVLIGVSLGLIIGFVTNVFVILIGAICVFVAIIYSYGPLPLKNTPLGEVVSGITMGMLIPLAFLFTQDSSLFISSFTFQQLTINVSMIIVWGLILLIPTLTIANIMLANNICDVKKDSENSRVTLPLVIGTALASKLFILMYTVCYMLIVALILLNVFPVINIISLSTLPIVISNSRKFVAEPVKVKTFKYAVFNLQLILLSVIVPIVISLWIQL